MQFSVIVTSHNQREFIRDAVDSALAARTRDTEVVVVDDASRDGSQDVLRRYGQAIRFFAHQKNRGPCAARNFGASQAIGEYLVFLDGDDALQPWALEVYERIIRARKPTLVLSCVAWAEHTLPSMRGRARPTQIEYVEYTDYYHRDRAFACTASAIVVARHALRRVGGWSEVFSLMTDQDLLLKLGDAGCAIQILSPSTCLYRVHTGNRGNRAPRYVRQLHKLIAKERAGEYPGGRERRFERYVVLGREVFHWVRRAVEGGFYSDAFQLAVAGWPMFAAASVRRVGQIFGGRLPYTTLAL